MHVNIENLDFKWYVMNITYAYAYACTLHLEKCCLRGRTRSYPASISARISVRMAERLALIARRFGQGL
jgi:hypothetical protein